MPNDKQQITWEIKQRQTEAIATEKNNNNNESTQRNEMNTMWTAFTFPRWWACWWWSVTRLCLRISVSSKWREREEKKRNHKSQSILLTHRDTFSIRGPKQCLLVSFSLYSAVFWRRNESDSEWPFGHFDAKQKGRKKSRVLDSPC